MPNFAVLSGSLVSNVIVAETKEVAESITGLTCIQYSKENPAIIGYEYDFDLETFVEPVLEGDSNA
jgi:hypothetical protein